MRNFKPLAVLCGCTAWFVSDLVGNPEDRFSHNEAHLLFDGLRIFCKGNTWNILHQHLSMLISAVHVDFAFSVRLLGRNCYKHFGGNFEKPNSNVW